MATPSPILVASDLSHRSDRALSRAFHIARDLGAPVVVLTVLDDALPADLMPDLHQRTRERLDRFVRTLAREDVPFTIEVQTGDPAEDILSALAAIKPQLLVLGTHRTRPFMDLLRETTMQRIVRRSSVPVLLATDRDDHDYDRVLVPTDFSPAATAAARMAQVLAPKAQMTALHALHVPFSGMLASTPSAHADLEKPFRHDAEGADAGWRRDAAIAGLPATDIVVGPALGLVHKRVAERGIDLVAVGAHGRAGAARAVLGSLAIDLMREPPCDLLIARP